MKNCEFCGEAMNKNNKRFCSRSCAGKYGNSVRSYKIGKVKKNCLNCGESYEIKKSRETSSKFCSRHCHDKGKGAYREDGYSLGWYVENYKRPCVVCGYSTAVHIHHIQEKENGGNDNPENLVHLCPNHHAETHLGLISKEFLLKNSLMVTLESEKEHQRTSY